MTLPFNRPRVRELRDPRLADELARYVERCAVPGDDGRGYVVIPRRTTTGRPAGYVVGELVR